jgi:hypothetical protein
VSKRIGTPVESAVARFFQENGWPHCERRALSGVLDKGDLTGVPGLCVEIKGGKTAEHASDGQVEAWLRETETERVNAKADIGILVMKRKQISGTRAGEWWAVMDGGVFADLVYEPEPGARPFSRPIGAPVRAHLSTVVELLRDSGYGSQR